MHSTDTTPAYSDGARPESDRLNSDENGSKPSNQKRDALRTEILFPSDTFKKSRLSLLFDVRTGFNIFVSLPEYVF